jgi:hypothetical protein
MLRFCALAVVKAAAGAISKAAFGQVELASTKRQ